MGGGKGDICNISNNNNKKESWLCLDHDYTLMDFRNLL